jgi:hypothetical protein
VGDLEAAGTGLFAISYDSIEVLAGFADKYGITYPLLSDEGSNVIRALGLYNEHLAEQARFYGREARPDQYGVPYPGIFHLDERGVVIDRQFEQSYRVRPAPALLLDQTIAESHQQLAVAEAIERNSISIKVGVDTATYRPYEKHELKVILELPPGVHVYGSPVPEGYSALEINVAPFDGLNVGPARMPEARPFAVEGLDEKFLVYEGRIETKVPFNIVPFLESVNLSVEVAYQACTESLCYPPEAVTLDLTLRGIDLVRD